VKMMLNRCTHKKIYHQTTGGAMGSSFTLTLANIFMWKWQKQFVRQQDITSEFFGRYIDDIFITWNGTEKELIKFLNEANTWHPNIKLDYKIGQSLPFLDILLTNNNEQFFLMRNKLFSQFIYESSHVSEDNALINTVNIRTAQVPQNTTTEINVEHNTTTITTPKRNNTLFLHYTYEQRFKPMKRGLHHIHKDIFSQSQTQNVKMIVGNRNRRNATHELIRKRPPRFILKNQKRPKRINSTINKQTTTTTTLTTPAYSNLDNQQK
ncbi:unnamed protein product, partial [Adineta steineri]